MSTAIVLFRRDLRLADNPALSAACAACDRVLPVYVLDDARDGRWPPGAASRWWLHHSLAALQASLAARQGALHLARGDTLEIVREFARVTRATRVFWNRVYEPAPLAADARLGAALREDGLHVDEHPGNLWNEPWSLGTDAGQPYRVFTPFWRKQRAQLPLARPLPAATPRNWTQAAGGLPLAALRLRPSTRWDAGLADAWRPGEDGAHEMLGIFADDALDNYGQGRDRPARHGTSRLSPHLHFGEITPGQVHRHLHDRAEHANSVRRPDLEPFLRQLGWREFAHHLLRHFPETPNANFNRRFDRFRWADDPGVLARWQQGRTGIPLVDAGMRELWHTGWMHNRVRMVTASFLTKNLRQHWLHGARWFWDTLVDADLANNTLGWQWVAGCGADAAPYFRIFNPYLQAARFDPDAAYIKRWLPELSAFPARTLHEAWKHTPALVAQGYPPPMVDIGVSRVAALAAHQGM